MDRVKAKDLFTANGRTHYAYGLTAVLVGMSAAFAYLMPEAAITTILVEQGFSVVQIIVIAYLTAATVDKIPAWRGMPWTNKGRSREIAEAMEMERDPYTDRRNDQYAQPVG